MSRKHKRSKHNGASKNEPRAEQASKDLPEIDPAIAAGILKAMEGKENSTVLVLADDPEVREGLYVAFVAARNMMEVDVETDLTRSEATAVGVYALLTSGGDFNAAAELWGARQLKMQQKMLEEAKRVAAHGNVPADDGQNQSEREGETRSQES